jgi:hypothetical protein
MDEVQRCQWQQHKCDKRRKLLFRARQAYAAGAEDKFAAWRAANPIAAYVADLPTRPIMYSKGWHQLGRLPSVPIGYYSSDHTEALLSTEAVRGYFFSAHSSSAARSGLRVIWLRTGSGTSGDISTFAKMLRRADGRGAVPPFTLITSDGDSAVPGQMEGAREILRHPRLVRWLTQNHDGTRGVAKLQALPIGLDLSGSCHVSKPHAFLSPRKRFELMQATRRQHSKAPFAQRDGRPLLDFGADSNRIREEVRRQLARCPGVVDTSSHRLPQAQVHQQYARRQFVISLQGNGLDCHRTWEALYFGAIVLAQPTNWAVESLYTGLPVVVVRDWARVCDREWLEGVAARLGPLTHTAHERVADPRSWVFGRK